MRIFKHICALITLVCASLTMSSCASSTTELPAIPREITCIMEYTGATYNPFHIPRPYKYALYDINGGFIGYLDTTRVVTHRMEPLMGKLVRVRGTIVKRDDDNVVCAESIRLAR